MFELLAVALAVSQPTTGAEMDAPAPPEDIASLELAKFRKPIKYADRHSLVAEKAAKQENCSLPVDEYQWIHAKVEAAIFVSPAGEIEKILPVSSGCAALEKFTGEHLAKYAKNIAPIPPDGKAKWYRTAMHFRWPE